jgi:hypothetical protein
VPCGEEEDEGRDTCSAGRRWWGWRALLIKATLLTRSHALSRGEVVWCGGVMWRVSSRSYPHALLFRFFNFLFWTFEAFVSVLRFLKVYVIIGYARTRMHISGVFSANDLTLYSHQEKTLYYTID